MKRLGAVVAAAAFAAGLLVALPGPATAAKVLRVTLQLPMDNHLGRNLLLFKEDVERETGGEIRVEVYSSAVFYKDHEVPDAVSSGAIEMGVASLTQFAGTIPAVDIFYVPFMFPSVDVLNRATERDSPVRGPLDAAILETGARVLWWQPFGGTVLLSKRSPIISPDEIAGKKVRVFSKTLGAFVEALGGTAVETAGSEQRLAYIRGTVDAGMTGVTAVVSRGLYEAMDHLTTVDIAPVEFVVLINETAWRGFTEAERSTITAAAGRAEAKLRGEVERLEAEAFETVRAKMNVVGLGPEQLAAWRLSNRPVLDAYLKRSGTLGRTLADAVRALR